MSSIIDATGMKFGRLTVIGFSHVARKRAFWICSCECGNTVVVAGSHLRSGHTRSCGCLLKEARIKASTKHGLCNTRLYSVWRTMFQRTTNRKHKEYKNYGARGVHVCDEWKDFSKFAEWSFNNGYEDSLSIDRINFNGDYCPSNCRWATMKQQQRNRRNNRVIEYNGERRCLSEWAELLGFTHKELSYRLGKGWPLDRAFTEPLKQKGAKLCG